jgi:hypothetical protein
MTEEKFKLPRSSYDELCKIIKAYGRLNKPSTLSEVDHIVGIGKTNVSANNAFLLAVEIVEGIKSKSPTGKGFELARALEFDSRAKIAQAWRRIIEENDFLSKMVQAVSVRKGMEVSHLQGHIAYSAGEPKASYVMTGAKAVIDILLASEFVKQEGDQIIVNTTLSADSQQLEAVAQPMAEIEPITVISVPLSQRTQDVTLHIEVRVNATPAELDGLGEKLRELIDSISKQESTSDSTAQG